MLAKDIMFTDLPIVAGDASVQIIAKEMVEKKTSHVMVTDGERLLGIVSGYDLRKAVADESVNLTALQIMRPREELIVVNADTPLETIAELLSHRRISQVPVMQGELPIGFLSLSNVLNFTTKTAKKAKDQLGQFRQAAVLIESMGEGLVVVDRNYCVCEFNPTAERCSGIVAKDIVGRKSRLYMSERSPVKKVMETGEALLNVEVVGEQGRVYMTNNVPIMVDGDIQGVLQTFTDITEMKQMHDQLRRTNDELEKAFALTLPNQRVEQKLKKTYEYRDVYDCGTGLIKITEVIPDGGYLHVVNALKVAADLNEKGLMVLLGIDKDKLVQALIFHDVGKSQPDLQVGQEVDPKKVFEESRMHAERSADIVENFYGKSNDVIHLIRYHHHEEHELPEQFPRHLLPMLRLLKVIDGLSAGLTRRSAQVSFQVDGSRLTVIEKNGHPGFNRVVELDLYTGQEFVYTETKMACCRQEA